MAHKPNLFRKALEALIDGRQRSAQRFVETYQRDHNITPPAKNS